MSGTLPYVVTVENITRGWSYESTQGEVPDRADPVQLADDLVYGWAFDDELVPHALHSLTLALALWCHSNGDAPTCDLSDELRVTVVVDGTTVVESPAMLVTGVEVDTDLPPGALPDGYYVRMVVRANDDTGQLAARKPQPRGLTGVWGSWPLGTPVGQQRFTKRLAEIGQQVARTIGVPSWWADDATYGPLAAAQQVQVMGVPGGTENHVESVLWTEDAQTMLESTVNTGQPLRMHHTLVPQLGSSYPAGYKSSTYQAGTGLDPPTGLADSGSGKGLLVVPASRRTTNQAWPLELVVSGLLLTLQPAAAGTQVGHDAIGVDAAWCDLPVRARRAREHVVNTVELKSLLWRTRYNPGDPASESSTVPGSVTVTDPDKPAGELVNRRTVPTYIWALGQEPGSTFAAGESALAYQGDHWDYLWWSDDSQREAWVFDAFTLRGSRVPEALWDRVLPRLAPRIPGETDGTGHVLKHLTIYRPADAVRYADQPGLVTGFVTQGQLRVLRGDLVFTLTLTPGLPVALTSAGAETDRATPVTVAQVEAATYAAQPAADIDPRIRVSDLAHVAA